MISIGFDFSKIAAKLDGLTKAATDAVRPAAQAGAQVFYDEVLLRVPVNAKTVKRKSGKIIPPGALRASIYQVFSKDNSPDGRATYHISWNARKAPHGHLVEFGTSRAPAHPFLRPSYDTRAQAALVAAETKFTEGMQPVLSGMKS